MLALKPTFANTRALVSALALAWLPLNAAAGDQPAQDNTPAGVVIDQATNSIGNMSLIKYQGTKETPLRAQTHARSVADKIFEKTGIKTVPQVIVASDIEGGGFRVIAFGKSIFEFGYADLGPNGPETMRKIHDAYEQRTDEYIVELQTRRDKEYETKRGELIAELDALLKLTKS